MRQGGSNVGLLFSLVATSQQQNQPLSSLGVIHAIAWPVVYAQFPNSILKRFAVSKIAGGHTLHPHQYTGSRLSVCQPGKPLNEGVFPVGTQVI